MSLVRGKLSKLSRAIMSALIVMEVHARDVVNKMLEEEAKNVNDFEWISQLRLVPESRHVHVHVHVWMHVADYTPHACA